MSSKVVKTGEIRVFEYPTVSLESPPGGALQGKSAHRFRAGDFPGKGPKSDPEEVEEEAFQKGYQAGEKSGLKMAEEKIDSIVKKVAKSLEELARLRHQMVLEGEKDLVKLAIEIAKKLVHREIHLDEKIIVSLVRVALEQLTDKSQIIVFAHPSDYKVLRKHLDEVSPANTGTTLVLKVDEKLDRGDCLIESESGIVDARISEQFQEIENGLLSEF